MLSGHRIHRSDESDRCIFIDGLVSDMRADLYFCFWFYYYYFLENKFVHVKSIQSMGGRFHFLSQVSLAEGTLS